MPQTFQRQNWLILAAIVLLALIPFAIHHSGKDESPVTDSSARKISPSGVNPLSGRSSQGRQRSTNQDLPSSHSTEDLNSFFLPPTKLSQVTLKEAMDALLSQYQSICRETSESPILFHYTIHGNPDPISYLKLGGDFISNCKFIAAMAAMTLKIEGDQLTFTEVPDGPPVQRRWTVPPTFPSFLPDPTELGITIDPFEDPFYSRPDVREVLLGLGVIKENDPVSFLTSSSTLILRSEAKNLVKVDGLVGKAISDTPFQTRIRFPDEPTPNLGMIIPPGGLGLRQKNGSSDRTSPDIQFLVASFEWGFGRKLQTVSFTGDLPSNEAQALFLETGNVSDLGIRDSLSHAIFNITRQSYEEETHSFSYRDKDGKSYELPFITERIDASGQVIPSPISEGE